MSKSTQAFKTIRDVSELLDVKAHSLRFWESKFPQVRPVTRAGRRRYYRPSDVQLLAGIRVLIQDEQKTTKEVKAIFKDQGQGYVIDMGQKYLDQSSGSPTSERTDVNEQRQSLLVLTEQTDLNEHENIPNTQELQQKALNFQTDDTQLTDNSSNKITFFQVAGCIRTDQYFKLPEDQMQHLILRLESLLERLNTEHVS